jgi:hypothetical protein
VFTYCRPTSWFLGASAKLRRVTVSSHDVCQSVRCYH